MKIRKNSFAFCGGAYGDEGKGRIVDKYVHDLAKKGPVIVYRDNGGANAGHTVELEDGRRIALHQLPSGVFVDKAVVVLGKGMVLHPRDLLEEIEQVREACGGKIRCRIMIDEMAVLSLDTHRAFEAVLKEWQDGSKGSTGRGISPAYTDVLLRHPLRMRDLVVFEEDKIRKHYQLYEGLIAGLGQKLSEVMVPLLGKEEKFAVGSMEEFINKLLVAKKELAPYITSVFDFLSKSWLDKKTAFVFEKAQAVGLDPRYGVYPDVTASDTTLGGLLPSTEGIVDSEEIEIRAGTIKATYMSSVGIRKLPTVMEEDLANKIREDAHEYGATTKRPRGIAYLDLPTLKFFCRVGKINCLVLTHMDIVYPKVPIKICVAYKRNGQEVPYRPDQEYLNTVTPRYVEMPPWDRQAIQKAKTREELPGEAKDFLDFICREIGVPVLMITTGPRREQGIIFK
jgi:adenylosuccinate synthase